MSQYSPNEAQKTFSSIISSKMKFDDKQMIVEQIGCDINIPFSTSTEYLCALDFATENGMVLQLETMGIT